MENVPVLDLIQSIVLAVLAFFAAKKKPQGK